MRYLIFAREWTPELKARFNKVESIIPAAELSSDDIVDLIIAHGKAEIVDIEDGLRILTFENEEA